MILGKNGTGNNHTNGKVGEKGRMILYLPKPQTQTSTQTQNSTENPQPRYWKCAIFTYFSIWAIITCAIITCAILAGNPFV